MKKQIIDYVMTLLLALALLGVVFYHGGCIQTKHYKIELDEEQKAQIAEMMAEKLAEDEKQQIEEAK